MAAHSVEFIQINTHMEGQRIDNFLLTHLKGVPRSMVYRILRKGEVRVNKGRIKPHYRLKAGDEVRIPPVRRSESAASDFVPSESLRHKIENAILYEDERLLVINKPHGLAVHGGSGIKHGLIETLRSCRENTPFLELVHRLDRETSGCLMIAKRRSMLRTLHELLRSNKVHKRYLALLLGQIKRKKFSVKRALKKNILASGERIVRIDAEQGKKSVTHYSLLASSRLASLCEVEIETGRTHQIRVHSQSLQHPVAGDEKYGDSDFNRQMKNIGLKRMFLHAYEIEFTLPESGKLVKVRAPLDDNLRTVLTNLDIDVPDAV